MLDFSHLGPRVRDPDKAAQVKRWAQDAFNLQDGVTIMVTELRCTEPDCPPLETVIAVMHADARQPVQYKLHKPLAAVSQADLSSLTTQHAAGRDR